VTYPFETLVETVTRGSTSSLDVPSSLTERVETELVSDLGGVHGVGQILNGQSRFTASPGLTRQCNSDGDTGMV
jgi:hypothetical protein